MNGVINKFLLAISLYGPFTLNKEQTQKIKETRDSRYICQNELDKACFQHNMTYSAQQYKK